jgi:Zn-dependent M28 family amino/carboxypeptidase
MSTEKSEVKPAPGYYMAKIGNYGIKKTKAGDPAPTIVFEVNVDGANHRVFWQGTLKDGPGRDITMKALAVCGFTNVRAFPYLADGLSSGLLDVKKEVQITVEHEKAIDDPEKVYPRVKWINDAGGGKFKDAISTQDAITLMQGMGLEGDFMRIAQENGFKVSHDPVKAKKKEADPFTELSNMDIPF